MVTLLFCEWCDADVTDVTDVTVIHGEVWILGDVDVIVWCFGCFSKNECSVSFRASCGGSLM